MKNYKWVKIFEQTLHKIFKWAINTGKWSTSLVIRDMQIKTTMKDHCQPIKTDKTEKSINTKCW